MVPKFSKILPKLSSELSPELIQSLGKIPWDFQLIHSTTELHLFIFLGPKFKIYDMIMVSLRIIKYCYDSPMEKNEIETVWSQNNIILRLVPPIQTHFLNQNLWEWEKYPNLAPRLGNSGPKFLGLGWARVNFGDLIPVMPIWKCWDNL